MTIDPGSFWAGMFAGIAVSFIVMVIGLFWVSLRREAKDAKSTDAEPKS